MHRPFESFAPRVSADLSDPWSVGQAPPVLVSRGLGSSDAANLIARFAGLRVGAVAWTPDEVSRLLFLRHLYRSARFSEAIPRPEPRAAIDGSA